MHARRSLALLGALCVVALTRCASDDIQTSFIHDPLSVFPAQATFRWDIAANRLPTDERVAALDLDPLIREAANQEFSLRGYRMAASRTSDYRLSYQVAVHTWIGPDNSTSTATLSLMLVDVKLDRRVWLGYGRAELRVGISRDERMKTLRGAIAKMLKKFPPNQGSI